MHTFVCAIVQRYTYIGQPHVTKITARYMGIQSY